MKHATDTWQEYYQQALKRPHSVKAELAIEYNESGNNLAIDCGCGVGSDVDFFLKHGLKVVGFDVNSDAIAICRERFGNQAQLVQSTFEDFSYPKAGIVLANASLYFAKPESFESTWGKISACIEPGGVFVGDFMGTKDTWASDFIIPIKSLTKEAVIQLFAGFEVLRFKERDEAGTTANGQIKQWHTFTVLAIKRSEGK